MRDAAQEHVCARGEVSGAAGYGDCREHVHYRRVGLQQHVLVEPEYGPSWAGNVRTVVLLQVLTTHRTYGPLCCIFYYFIMEEK